MIRVNQVILASHGGLAAGMRDTVELIVGEVPNVHVLSTTRDETEPIAVRARRLLEGFDPADAVEPLSDGEIEEFLEEARGQIVNCNKLLRQAAENEEDDL